MGARKGEQEKHRMVRGKSEKEKRRKGRKTGIREINCREGRKEEKKGDGRIGRLASVKEEMEGNDMKEHNR